MGLDETGGRYSEPCYTVRVILEVDEDGDSFYLASHPELDGCMAQGDTWEEAVESLRGVRELFISSLIRRGLPVPPPLVLRGYSPRAPAPDAYEAYLGERSPQ